MLFVLVGLVGAACSNSSSGQTGTTTIDSNGATESVESQPSLETVELADGTQMVIERDVSIPMEDGIVLSANVFRPDSDDEFPTLVGTTPYNKDFAGDYDPEDGKIDVSEYAPFELPDPAFWVPNGYALAVVDARGMNASEGDTALLTELEARDYYDTIEWLAEQPWSNGNIGLNGVSYMALNQWGVAALAPPSLKAIMPWEGFTDVYRDMAYHGGIPETDFLPSWWEFRILETKNESAVDQDLPTLFGENSLDSEFYDDFRPTNLSDITVPAYVGASWSDQGLHTRGTLEGFDQISSENKWLEIHGRKKWEEYYSEDAQKRQLQFFDQFLNEEDSGMLAVPTVSYELRSGYYEGETKTSPVWPIEGQDASLFLDAATAKLQTSPSATNSEVSYLAEGEPDDLSEDNRAVFEYEFVEKTEITGGMNLKLWIETDEADDTDLFVGVQKQTTDGEQVHFEGNGIDDGQVANGWLRASHRGLDTSKSTPTRPYHSHASEEKLTPGEPVMVEVEVHPSSTLFDAGDKLVVVVQGVDMVEGGLEHQSLSSGSVKIRTGADYPSQLTYRLVG